MGNQVNKAEAGEVAGFVPLNSFLDDLEVCYMTGWRWRQRGWISTVQIAGKHYLSLEEIRRWRERAAKGEFTMARVSEFKSRSQAGTGK